MGLKSAKIKKKGIMVFNGGSSINLFSWKIEYEKFLYVSENSAYVNYSKIQHDITVQIFMQSYV